MTEPREIPTGWSPRGDRMLALLPVEHPTSFDALPFEEQRWRGRVFLMVYTQSGSIPYSWYQAMALEDPEIKAMALGVDEDELVFRLSEAAAGRWYGPPEQPEMAGAPGSPGPA